MWKFKCYYNYDFVTCNINFLFWMYVFVVCYLVLVAILQILKIIEIGDQVYKFTDRGRTILLLILYSDLFAILHRLISRYFWFIFDGIVCKQPPYWMIIGSFVMSLIALCSPMDFNDNLILEFKKLLHFLKVQRDAYDPKLNLKNFIESYSKNYIYNYIDTYIRIFKYYWAVKDPSSNLIQYLWHCSQKYSKLLIQKLIIYYQNFVIDYKNYTYQWISTAPDFNFYQYTKYRFDEYFYRSINIYFFVYKMQWMMDRPDLTLQQYTIKRLLSYYQRFTY